LHPSLLDAEKDPNNNLIYKTTLKGVRFLHCCAQIKSLIAPSVKLGMQGELLFLWKYLPMSLNVIPVHFGSMSYPTQEDELWAKEAQAEDVKNAGFKVPVGIPKRPKKKRRTVCSSGKHNSE